MRKKKAVVRSLALQKSHRIYGKLVFLVNLTIGPSFFINHSCRLKKTPYRIWGVMCFQSPLNFRRFYSTTIRIKRLNRPQRNSAAKAFFEINNAFRHQNPWKMKVLGCRPSIYIYRGHNHQKWRIPVGSHGGWECFQDTILSLFDRFPTDSGTLPKGNKTNGWLKNIPLNHQEWFESKSLGILESPFTVVFSWFHDQKKKKEHFGEQ